jgi:hypothetical protein
MPAGRFYRVMKVVKEENQNRMQNCLCARMLRAVLSTLELPYITFCTKVQLCFPQIDVLLSTGKQYGQPEYVLPVCVVYRLKEY